MKKNIFILFAPGLGGNHLANILSLDPRYRARITESTYNSPSKVAHGDVLNLQYHSLKQNLDLLIDQNNIFCGHWLEYALLKESDLIQYFPNRVFCVIQMPEVNSQFYQRFLQFNNNVTPWLFHEVTLLYKKEYILNLISESSSHFVYVWPNMMANPDIKILIDDLNNQGLDISPNLEEAQHYHDLWINKNFNNYEHSPTS